MVLTRTLLVSLIFCLLASTAVGAITDSGGNTTFLWAAEADSNAENGGGAKTSAWEAGVPTDFLAANTGGPTSLTLAWNGADTANTVVEHTANAVKVVSGNPAEDWFRDCKTGTIGYFRFNTNSGLNGYYYITRIDDDSLSIDGLTYSGDFGGVDDDCDVRVGGAVKLLGGIINSNLADASSVNCTVLIKGNETTGAITVSAGGGSTTTLLSFIGVDSSWVPIALTATSGWPEITNSGMITFNDQNLFVRGLKFISNVANATVQLSSRGGGIASCHITNSNAGGKGLTLNNGYAINCYIQSAGRGISMSRGALYGCTIKVTGTDYGVYAEAGNGSFNIVSCIIQGSGTGSNGIFVNSLQDYASPCSIINNTIDDWADCIHLDEMPEPGDNGSLLIANNILSDYSSYGIDKTSGDEQGIGVFNNAFWDAQSTGNTTNLESLPIYLNITLTGDPYTTQGTDYSLNNTAGAGAAVRAAGFPGARVDGNNTGYGDVAALQHQDIGGNGNGGFPATSMLGGLIQE